MKVVTVLGIVLLISLLTVTTVSIRAGNTGSDLKEEQSRAFASIVAAQESGANVTNQVHEFNSAISLNEHNGGYSADSCTDAATCNLESRAIKEFQSVSNESSRLRGNSLATDQADQITVLPITAVSSMVVALVITLIWKFWRRALFNQFLGMEVRTKRT